MPSQLDIAPEGTGGAGSGGGGPEGGGGSRGFVQRTEGFLTLAFGFALGLALVVLFWLINKYGPDGAVKEFVAKINLVYAFLYGFVAGTITSAIYNLLVVRRINLFGLESSAD